MSAHSMWLNVTKIIKKVRKDDCCPVASNLSFWSNFFMRISATLLDSRFGTFTAWRLKALDESTQKQICHTDTTNTHDLCFWGQPRRNTTHEILHWDTFYENWYDHSFRHFVIIQECHRQLTDNVYSSRMSAMTHSNNQLKVNTEKSDDTADITDH